MTTHLKEICSIQGLDYLSSRIVSGGDINKAYSIETENGSYFIKLNSSTLYPLMFEKEAEGLNEWRKAAMLLKVPLVMATGELDSQQYLLMEWVEKANPSKGFWNRLAEGLAQLHKSSHSHFGWYSSNYIGSVVQQNTFTLEWSEFYATQRILPLVKELFNSSSFSKADLLAAENVCRRLDELFPKAPPSLVHGDLWAGNFMAGESNDALMSRNDVVPCIYDPAIYYGHREMDIGMSLLFGGSDTSFYDVYQEHYPLEKGWRNRISLTQLYPLLVHAVLFGGEYISQCREILKRWA